MAENKTYTTSNEMRESLDGRQYKPQQSIIHNIIDEIQFSDKPVVIIVQDGHTGVGEKSHAKHVSAVINEGVKNDPNIQSVYLPRFTSESEIDNNYKDILVSNSLNINEKDLNEQHKTAKEFVGDVHGRGNDLKAYQAIAEVSKDKEVVCQFCF